MSMNHDLNPESAPPTERVPGGRGKPLLVTLAVVAALAVFVAQPWQDQASSPSPVALASASQPASPGATPLPTNVPTPTPTAPPPVLPSPDLGPLSAPGEVALSAEPGTPVVRCSYGRRHHGVRRLVAVMVSPPIVTLDPESDATDISHVAWRFVLETNEQQHILDADWLPAGASRTQAAGTAQGRAAPFTSLSLRTRTQDMPDTVVYRVRVVVEWFTRNIELAGHAELLAAPYQAANATPDDSQWPYCAGVLLSS